MAAVFEEMDASARLALLRGDPRRTVVWRHGRALCLDEFRAAVRARAALLPEAAFALNLCDDRYEFLLTFCAVAARGQANLLPPSRAPDIVAEIAARYPGSYSVGDLPMADPPPDYLHIAPTADVSPGCGPNANPGSSAESGAAAVPPDLGIAAAGTVLIGFTSGSTGLPKPNAKAWSSLSAGNAMNASHLRAHLRLGAEECLNILATVPPQHMYGIETSVLLPLLDHCSVSSARPLFPAEIVAELEKLPAPRLLVTTPVHLRNLLDSLEAGGAGLPQLAGIVCATAPLTAELAQRAESVCAAPLVELFGSTETCVIAHRRTALAPTWQLYPGVELKPQPDGALAEIAWYPQPVPLQDLVELAGGGRFELRGRSADLLEIAGKRASLADLTRRVLAVDGVVDAAVFQCRPREGARVQRIAAVAVAPGRSAAQILEVLRRSVDPVFLPRPLRLVERLPRNETGKLPQAALLELLRETAE